MEQKKTTSTPNKKPSKQRFRLILQEEGTFAERWAMKVQPLQLKWLAAGSVIIVALITYALIAWTPLREVVVPGYMTTESRVMQKEAIQTADSLSNILEAQGRYIANLKAIFSGELPPQSMEVISNTAPLRPLLHLSHNNLVRRSRAFVPASKKRTPLPLENPGV